MCDKCSKKQIKVKFNGTELKVIAQLYTGFHNAGHMTEGFVRYLSEHTIAVYNELSPADAQKLHDKLIAAAKAIGLETAGVTEINLNEGPQIPKGDPRWN